MAITITTSGNSKPNSVYISGLNVALAESASLINIFVNGGTVNVPNVPLVNQLTSHGLILDTGVLPNTIYGDPIVPTLSIVDVIQVVCTGSPTNGDFNNDFNDDFLLNLAPFSAFNIEIIAPTFITEDIECSFNKTITDTTYIFNPNLEGRGTITYYIKKDNVWINVGQIPLGGSFTLNGCQFSIGTFDVKAVYTVTEFTSGGCGCGGSSTDGGEIIFQSEYNTTITFEEFRPNLTLSYESASECSMDCCEATMGVPVTVTSSFSTVPIIGFATLTYSLYDHDGALLINTDPANPTDPLTFIYTTTVPNSLPNLKTHDYIFTPTENCDYRLVVTLNDGVCDCIVTKEIIIRSCHPYKLKYESCKTYSFSNCSLQDTIKISLYDLKNNIINNIDKQVVIPNQIVSVVVPKDGIYILKIYDIDDVLVNEYVIIEYCDILSCLTSKLQNILCAEDCGCKSTDKCADDCKKRLDMNRIIPLAYMFFNYVNREYSLNTIYDMIDNAKITELTSIQEVVDILSCVCSECSSSFDSGISGIASPRKGDCGCK